MPIASIGPATAATARGPYRSTATPIKRAQSASRNCPHSGAEPTAAIAQPVSATIGLTKTPSVNNSNWPVPRNRFNPAPTTVAGPQNTRVCMSSPVVFSLDSSAMSLTSFTAYRTTSLRYLQQACLASWRAPAPRNIPHRIRRQRPLPQRAGRGSECHVCQAHARTHRLIIHRTRT